MALVWRLAGRFWPFSRTTNRPTARSKCRLYCGPLWAAETSSVHACNKQHVAVVNWISAHRRAGASPGRVTAMRWPTVILFSMVIAGSLVGVAFKRYADHLAELRHA